MSRVLVVLALLGGVARADWPRAAIDRPLVLDRGLVEVDAIGGFAARRVLGLALDDGGLALGARCGATSRLELGAATAVDVAPDVAWTGLVRGALAYRAIEAPRLDVAWTARLDGCAACGFSIFSTAAAGAPVRWRASERVYLHAGRELLPWTIRPYLALDLSLRAGAGVQLTSRVAAEVDAELARVTIAGQVRDDRWLAHAPVVVSAIASVAPRVDLGLAIAVDRASAPRDGWRALVTVAARSR